MLRRAAGLLSVALLVYACTLDFEQYRDPNAGGTTTTGGMGGTSTTGGEGGVSTSAGGDGGTAATGGMGGMGGGGNMTTCPGSTPDVGTDCDEVGQVCLYGDRHCHCWRGEWECTDCPATEPVDDTDCGPFDSGERCFYGGTQCYCTFQGTDWNCEQCPTDPQDGEECDGLHVLHCAGSDGECSCFQGDWGCD